jgi:hypothetical protein
MTKIMTPMYNYISWKNIVEKNEDLWVPSFSFGGILIFVMESSSYNGRKMENDEEN